MSSDDFIIFEYGQAWLANSAWLATFWMGFDAQLKFPFGCRHSQFLYRQTFLFFLHFLSQKQLVRLSKAIAHVSTIQTNYDAPRFVTRMLAFIALISYTMACRMRVNVMFIHAKFLEIRLNNCVHIQNMLNKCNTAAFTFRYIDDDDMLSVFDETSPSPFPFNNTKRVLNKHERSNVNNHRSALKAASLADSDVDPYDFHLILEDDCMCQEIVSASLMSVMESYKECPWDVLFLGTPQKTDDMVPGIASITNHMWCCDSYIIPRGAADMLSRYFDKPVRFPTNIQFWYIFHQHPEIKASYSIPQIFIDGSKIGFAVSTMSSNNKLIYNNDYLKFHEGYKDMHGIPETILKNPHPDMQFVVALYHIHHKDYRKAEIMLATLFSTYKENHVIFDNTSVFLETYANIFRFMQDSVDIHV